MYAPGSLASLRQRNLALVLQAVRRLDATSRVDIVRATGLSRTTVSSLVAQLVRDGLLVEAADRPPATGLQAGRPPTRLSLDPQGGVLLGVHLGHDVVRVALADITGSVLEEDVSELDVDQLPDAALALVTRTAAALLARADVPPERLLCAGVAQSSPVPTSPGGGPQVLAAWQGVDVAGLLGTGLGVPVRVGNDANLGAVAERTFGAGRDTRHLLYVMLSDGIGAGLVLDSELYVGGAGTAGELGHVLVEPEGHLCRCGKRGCLETVAGTQALVRALGQALRSGDGTALSLEDVLRGCAQGDDRALRVVADAGRAVGRAVASAVMVLDPDLVVVGGTAAGAGEPLLAGLREQLYRDLGPGAGRRLEVVAGQLGARAEVLGAVALALAHAPLPGGGPVQVPVQARVR